jgi:transcriptional antiterminator NusG
VKLELSDEAWQLVTGQPRVTGFLGGKGKPVPITNSEAERLIRQMSEGVERPRTTVSFDIGEQVRVSDGHLHHLTDMLKRLTTTRRG